MTDYEAFASLLRELGPEEAAPSREHWARELVRGTLVDAEDDRVDGYVHVHTLGTVGYVRKLVVREPARGRGTGSELMLHAAAALRAAGIREWHLNVTQDNEAAIRLYERLGLRAEHRSSALLVPWSRVDALPSAPAIALPVAPEEDEDLELGLGLLAGQVAMARRTVGHVLRQLRDDDCTPVGFAAFDPKFAGARTFRVATPALAGTLLRALRFHARHEDLALVIDDDDALTQLLVTHGAIVKLQLLHYAGPLPEMVGI